jgi:hypothetical protein
MIVIEYFRHFRRFWRGYAQIKLSAKNNGAPALGQRFGGVPQIFFKQQILFLTIASKRHFKQSYLRVLAKTVYFSSCVVFRLGISGG